MSFSIMDDQLSLVLNGFSNQMTIKNSTQNISSSKWPKNPASLWSHSIYASSYSWNHFPVWFGNLAQFIVVHLQNFPYVYLISSSIKMTTILSLLVDRCKECFLSSKSNHESLLGCSTDLYSLQKSKMSWLSSL